ncbi:MAG: methylmalonyl Co-A mutase-associated GTPase MeaB [Acidimicrobiales bacterium]
MAPPSTSLAGAVRAGDRRALARSITLVESTRADHRQQAKELLDELLPHTGGARRIGLSGVPGSGKSTLVEALGLHAIDHGHRVAVLAVDPSSSVSGGSILGDKTRMVELGRHPDAFIRPSPSSGTLGGVARRTREALLLCEAAGFDVVMVETVGVGQSEVAVADLVDLFVLVASPAGGDELQGIKRGIMELADLIVVNKADGDLQAAAQRAAADLRHAVHLLRPKRAHWEVGVRTCSALTGEGLPELWTAITAAHDTLAAEGLVELRAHQGVAWMWSEVTETLIASLRADPGVRDRIHAVEEAVASGTTSPGAAADELLSVYLDRR